MITDTLKTMRQLSLAIGAIALGLVVLLTSALSTLWSMLPGVGPVVAAFLIGAGLVLYGVYSTIRAFRTESDERLAAVLAAIASILVGAVAFSWPVFTLTIFRLVFGGWLLFYGIRAIAVLLIRRRKTKPASKRAVWVHTIAAGLSLILAALLAFGSNLALGGTLQPAPGPFYAAPASVPSEHGKLIRSEPLNVGVPKGAEAWKILYTTTHFDGTPAVSSGVIIAPAERGSDPLPLITVAHGTTGIATGCAPSLSQTPFVDGAGTALEEMVVDHGWAAVISDYIGLGTSGTHPYLIGDAEARNVLDASLAAQEFSELSLSERTVIWGHSQGGQGALWTGQEAGSYAPELTVLGIAAFAPATDLLGLAKAVKNEAAGKVVSAYIASTWENIYPELDLAKTLTPGSKGGVDRIQGLCFNGQDVISAVLSGTQIPNQLFPDSALNGALGKKLSAQEPVGPFPAPVMVAQGLADPLVKPELQSKWVEARCAAGEEIDFREFKGLGHVDLVAANSPLTPEIVSWTLDRWDGKPATPNCKS